MCLSIPFSWLIPEVEGMNYSHLLALAITLTKCHRIMESFRLEMAFVLDPLGAFPQWEKLHLFLPTETCPDGQCRLTTNI